MRIWLNEVGRGGEGEKEREGKQKEEDVGRGG